MINTNCKFRKLFKIGSPLIILTATVVLSIYGLTSVEAAPVIQNQDQDVNKFSVVNAGSDVMGSSTTTPYQDIESDVNISGRTYMANNITTHNYLDKFTIDASGTIGNFAQNAPTGWRDAFKIFRAGNQIGSIGADNTGNKLQFFTGLTSDDTTARMTINNLGYVGIGNASPNYTLDVAGQITASQDIWAKARFCLGVDITGQPKSCITDWPTGSGSSLPTGTLGQTLRNDGTAVNNGWLANSNLFNDGTNVGIGTVTPMAKLDIRTTSGLKTAFDYGLYVQNQSTSTTSLVNRYGMYISSTGSWTGANSNNYGLYIDTPTGGTNNYGLIVAGGNSGIGTVTPASLFSVGASSEFQVNSTGNLIKINNVSYSWPAAQGAASTVLTNNGSGTLTWAPTSGGGSTIAGTPNYVSKFNAAGNNIIDSRIFDNGTNIGIGTAAPQDMLHISGNNPRVFIEAPGAGNMGWAGVRVKNGYHEYFTGIEAGNTGGWQIYDNTANPPFGALRFYLSGTGNIGIGNNTPAYKLDVTGDVKGTRLCIGADCRAVWPSGSGGGYATIQEEGVSLTQRTTLNFTGTGITCTDNTVSGRTDCTVPGGGAGGVTSVSNSDGTLTISPTTGAVISSLNLAHANTWTGAQSFNANTYFPSFGIWNTSGQVGINTNAPAAGTFLDVNGKAKMTGFQLGNSATSGYILTADASGNGTWQAPPAGGGGSLPNGTAAGQTPYWNGASWQVNGNLTNLGPSGNIGIGTVSPGAKVQINAPTTTEALRLVTDASTSPLNIRNSGNTADIFRVDQNGILQVGSVPWARLTSFPPACSAGQFVTAVGGALTCATPPAGGGGLGGSGTLNYVAKFTPNGTTLGNSLIFDNGTNLGIGTATPAMKLDVNGSILTNRNIYVQSPQPAPNNFVVGVGELQTAMADWGASGKKIFGIGWDSVGGLVGVGIPSNTTFGIYTNDNVSGGKANLEVRGNALIQGGPAFWIAPNNQATLSIGNGTKYIQANYGGSTYFKSDDPLVIQTSTTNSLTVGANNSVQMVFNGNGSIGVNTSSPNPLYKMDVVGDLNATRLCIAGICQGIWPSGGGGAVSSVAASNTTLTISPTTGVVLASLNLGSANTWTGAQTFSANTNFPGSGIWNTSGNLGVGIISPAAKLDVNGTAKMTGFQLTTAPTNGYVLTSNASGVGTWQLASGAIGGGGILNYIPKFTPNGTTLGASRIYEAAATGYTGIATTTPGTQLDVNGAIRTNNQLISTVGTGTAPLSVSSTTAVTNLNADLLDGQHASAFMNSTTDNWVNTIGDTMSGALTINNTLTVTGASTALYSNTTVDAGQANAGTWNNVLKFGGTGSGEGIASKRTAGGNQWGLDFYTASLNRVSITSTGFVGIGTAAPVTTLDIYTPTQTQGMRMTGPNAYAAVFSANLGGGGFNPITGNNDGGIFFGKGLGPDDPASAGFVIAPWSNTTSGIRLDRTGNVGIGTNNPSGYRLNVQGAINVNGNIYQNGALLSSDIRLKQNITPITSALDKVLKLEGVQFEFNQEKFPDLNFPKGTQIGFIAQKVEPIIPEVVTTDQKGYKYLAYSNLTALLVEAVKDLNNKISTIFTKLNQHDSQITKQQQMLDIQAKQIEQLQNEVQLLKSK